MKIWQKKYYRSHRIEKLRKRLQNIIGLAGKFDISFDNNEYLI